MPNDLIKYLKELVTDYHDSHSKAIEINSALGYAMRHMKFDSFSDVEKYLESFIPRADDRQNGKSKFDRAIYLMSSLGNPQNKIKVIHVAGTSGKSSTSQMIAQMLTRHGFKTGLTVSPHIVNLRERTQLDCRPISKEKYSKYLEEMIPAIVEVARSDLGAPSFFEITMAHAYYTFWKERVDYVIVEAGMGGRYDASNTATSDDKLAVIMKIGLDHQEFLGETISKIAMEKAHIIQNNNIAVSIRQKKNVQKVIQDVVKKKDAQINFVDIPMNIVSSKDKTEFDFSYKEFQIKNCKLPLRGRYQAENASVAISAVYELAQRDGFRITESSVRKSLQGVVVFGRFEIMDVKGKVVVVDGAHNAQKMDAFISSLISIYPNMNFDFLISFKSGKDYISMLKSIIPYTKKIYITEFEVYGHCLKLKPVSSGQITKTLSTLGHRNYQIYHSAKQALDLAVESPHGKLVITGSLYLVSELYSYILKIRNKKHV